MARKASAQLSVQVPTKGGRRLCLQTWHPGPDDRVSRYAMSPECTMGVHQRASAIAVRGWVDVELSVPTSAIPYRAALSGLSIRRCMQGNCRKSLPPRNQSRRRKPSSQDPRSFPFLTLRFPLSPFPTHSASRCPPCRRPSADSPSAASADFHLVHRGVPT